MLFCGSVSSTLHKFATSMMQITLKMSQIMLKLRYINFFLSMLKFKGHRSPEKAFLYIDVSLERIATSMHMILFCRLFLHSLVQLDFSLWSGK